MHFKNKNLSQINQKFPNESFLQKKRNHQTNSLFNNSEIIFEENKYFINNSFAIYKKDIEQTNYIQNKNEKLNENKINEFKKELKSNDNPKLNIILNDSNINNLDSLSKNNNKNINNIENILKVFPENNKINTSHVQNNINKNNKELFIITHEKNAKDNKNNDIKVFKNRKIVYINQSLLNSYNTSKNLKKAKNIAFIGETKRSSKYRGVSKNGNQWQVLFMNHNKKSYVGSYSSEEVAARIYDILEIKKRGIKARTNFKYNNIQMKKIKDMDIDIKSKNINDFIDNLFK